MTAPLLLIALLIAAPAAAQTGDGTLALDGTWKLARGDSIAWAAPGYDDRAWKTVKVPGEWETVEPGYDGFAWYRRTVELPASFAGKPVGIVLGSVGDAFELYWNGVKVGTSGRLPPRFVEGVPPTTVMIPEEAIAARADGRHVLAVRVYNDYAYGGLIGGVKVAPYELLAQRRSPRDTVIGGLVSFFLAIGIYHFAFFMRRRSARENLYFAVLSLSVSLYGATYAGAFQQWVMPVVNPYRLGLMGLLAGGPFFVALVYRLFELPIGRREKAISALFPVAIAVALLLPLGVLAEFNKWIDAGMAAGLLAVVVRAGMAASPHRPHAHMLLAGTAAFAATLVYDLGSEYFDWLPVATILPGVPGVFWIGFLVFVVCVGIATAGKWALTEVTALVDPLTELSRRHVLEEALRREAGRLRRTGGSLALVMIDLDHFKRINDAHGHGVGDQVLARVGRLLRSSARNIDLPARFGGEEFAVLLHDSTLEGAHAFADRFRANLRQLKVPVSGGAHVTVTASIGIAVGADLVDADELLETADRVLYRAKNEGRDHVIGVQLPSPGIPASPGG